MHCSTSKKKENCKQNLIRSGDHIFITTLITIINIISRSVVQYHDLEILAKKGCLSASLADILLRGS